MIASGIDLLRNHPRWTPLRPHRDQARLWRCDARFIVIEVARRAGKTELAKRKGVISALLAPIDGYYVAFCAPTRDQARAIYWDDLNALVPREFVRGVSKEHLELYLINGARIGVVGLDKPVRIEGQPIDRLFVDEFAEVKPGTWSKTLRPCCSTDGRLGKAWIYGVPRPSAQFKELVDLATIKREPGFAYFSWKTASVLPPEEIAAARASMDALLFAQEYEATRVNYGGRAYYAFERGVHGQFELPWNRTADLHVTFDFNTAPGTAAVHHEFETWPELKAKLPKLRDLFIGTIGEVWIPRHSRTEMVCDALLERFREHKGRVIIYGDATGGAGGSAKSNGSDWDQIHAKFNAAFPGRVVDRVPHSNPRERSRVNVANARMRSVDGSIGYLVDANQAPHVVDDWEQTVTLEGTAGELDKDSDPMHTHLSDGIGYLFWALDGENYQMTVEKY